MGNVHHRTSEIVIVSIFGRAHWLAVKMVRDGLPVKFIDLTHLMGGWHQEDIAGPFGFFKTDLMSDLQNETIFSEDTYEEIPNGFTLFLADGPLEMKGPLTSFRMNKMQVGQGIQDFFSQNNLEQKKAAYKEIRSLPFEQTWLLHLAHYLGGTLDIENSRAAFFGEALPLKSNFLRRMNGRSLQESSLKWMESQGVNVVKDKTIVDFSREGKSFLTGFEIRGEGVEFCEQLIWSLTSEETYFIGERLGTILFPKRKVDSLWSWVRYRIEIGPSNERDILPGHVCFIHHRDEPWTHENLMILLRTGSPSQFDLWLKIPSVQRFNKEYLNQQGRKALTHISNKLCGIEVSVVSYPQEYYYTYAQMGPSLYSTFSKEGLEMANRCSFKNVHLHSPENWSNFGWGCQFNRLESIYADVMKWWKFKQEKSQKRERKEVSL